MTCSEKCWTPVLCPDHGYPMTPFGRNAPESYPQCCENYAKSTLNPRHLWDEHDSTRWYTDTRGWNEHERNCEVCNPREES